MAFLHLLGFVLGVAGMALCGATGDWTAAAWAFASACWAITSWLRGKARVFR